MAATANFRMVRLGRELRGQTQTTLAKMSGVPQASLSRIEAGVREPTSDEVERIAAGLRLPVSFLLEPDAPAAAPLFRKRVIRSAKRQRMIQARVNTAVLAARRIIEAGIDIETPLTFPAPGDLPSDDPAGAAAHLRRAWGMPRGRVDNVTSLIEQAGGIVLHVDFGSDDASAAFVSSLGDAYLWFLVNTRETAGDRVRLSLSHELGHAVMHRFLPTHDEDRLEPGAYSFAVALLLPPDEFDAQIEPAMSLRRARDLKRAYQVSMQAIVRAARDRSLISGERYTSLYKQISARGWRHQEPEAVPIESASIWPSALAVHRDDHGYTDDELAAIAKLDLDDLADLFPREFRRRLRAVPAYSPAPPPSRPTATSSGRRRSRSA
jgi:Zn-dependent peptidase ImmA (M78 family)/transcriptional regulator with XRE-family HTH domain